MSGGGWVDGWMDCGVVGGIYIETRAGWGVVCGVNREEARVGKARWGATERSDA